MRTAISRIKQRLGKIWSWLMGVPSCIRRWPKKAWDWLAAIPGRIKRWVKNRWPVKLLILLAVLLFAVLTLNYSVPRLEPLTKSPKVVAEWVVRSMTANFLGLPIDVSLEITSPPQVVVDLDGLPQEGEMLGVFEVWRREVHCRRIDGGGKITEVRYQLLYLLPPEKGAFTKQELPRIRFDYYYLRRSSLTGNVYRTKREVTIQKGEIRITKRVGPDAKPYPLAGAVEEKFRFGKILRIAGAVVVLLIPVFWFVKLLVGVVTDIQEELERRAAYRAPSELLQEAWGMWIKTGNYRYFLEAAILVRNNLRHQLGLPPGGLLPRGEFWLVTTEALYSGRRFIEERIRSGFGLFGRTVSDKADKKPR